jgi:hypothetical protein
MNTGTSVLFIVPSKTRPCDPGQEEIFMAFVQEVPVLNEFDAAARSQHAVAELLSGSGSSSAQLQNCWGCGEVFLSQHQSTDSRICVSCRKDIAQQKVSHACIAFDSDRPVM